MHIDLLAIPFVAIWVAIFAAHWKSQLLPSPRLRSNRPALTFTIAVGLFCTSLLLLVLRFWSAEDVRSDWSEVIFYFALSLSWVALAMQAFTFLGVSLRDDVAERRNGAAAFAAGGFAIGTTFCAAGSNIGNGPGFEAVLFCMALSSSALMVLWVTFHKLTGAADTITIERDTGAGIRTGGWLAATGLILGISVAGGWTSASATLRDFARFAWPVLILIIFHCFFEKASNRRSLSKRPNPAVSGWIAIMMIAASAVYAKWVGLR